MGEKRIIQVDEKVPFLTGLPLSIQHLFAMFGASVLVPMIFGIDPAIVLFMNGVGTLLFAIITKGKSPAYLGSSFAYLAPATAVIGSFVAQGMSQTEAFAYAQGGFVVSGLLFCVVAIIIKLCGTKWINVVLPAAAMGPIIALIGLELAGTTISSVMPAEGVADTSTVVVFLVTILVAVLGSVLFRKFFAVIPILIAILSGYILALIFGAIDFSAISQAEVVKMPAFQIAKFDVNAIITILPATLVVISEHIGHQIVTAKVIGRDLLKDPGLHRSMLGDGLSSAISGFVGSVPTTTYGENIGVMAITGVYNVRVILGAAVISLVLSFFGTFTAAIGTIPTSVINGISFVLYGMIAASGIRLLVDRKVNYAKAKNLMLTSVVFITGLSGVAIKLGDVEIRGMALATIVGIVFGILFYIFEKLGIMNDKDVPETLDK